MGASMLCVAWLKGSSATYSVEAMDSLFHLCSDFSNDFILLFPRAYALFAGILRNRLLHKPNDGSSFDGCLWTAMQNLSLIMAVSCVLYFACANG